MGMKPERDSNLVDKSLLMAETVADLSIDGTERRRQRPQDSEQARGTLQWEERKPIQTRTGVGKQSNQENIGISAQRLVAKPMTRKWRTKIPSAIQLEPLLEKDTGFQGYEPSVS